MLPNATTVELGERGLSRRLFVVAGLSAAGGLVIGVTFPGVVNAVSPHLWSSEAAPANELNAFIVVESNNSVLIRCPHAEMGQGITTALAMIVAEELECDWSKVEVEYASATRNLRDGGVYGQMWTIGSYGVRTSYRMLQQAGASARVRLIAAAARRWRVPDRECAVQSGKVVHTPSSRTLAYGELAGDAAKIKLQKEPAIRTPDQFKLIGKPLPRLDTPLKINGSATYAIDVRIPAMVYAAVVACPVFGGRLKRVDDSNAKGRRGVEAIVRLDDAVAVVADRFWRAHEALRRLEVEWDTGPGGGMDSAQFGRMYREMLDGPMATARMDGAVDDAMGNAAKIVEALYETPLLAHATMEPLSATVDLKPDQLDVWIGSQGPMLALKQAAAMTGAAPEPPLALNQAAGVSGLAPDQIFIHNCFLGGGFGRRYMHDEMRQAILVAKAVGKPIKLVWTREEDMRHGRYRPQAATRLRAGLNADGRPIACDIATARGSLQRSLGFGKVESGVESQAVDGLTTTSYKIPHFRVACALQNTHVPLGAWRSVGHSINAFVMESFIDELAYTARQDPYRFRRALLGRADMIAVLDKVAEKSDWTVPLPPGRGRGVALHECYDTIIAEVAEVTMSASGELHVDRIVAAVDCGHVVNPNTAEAQIEGGIIYGLAAALHGEITIRDGRVEQGNFDDYRVTGLADSPKIEVHLIPTGGVRWGGIGEPGTAPVAPAVANALFAATGQRIRRLPLKQR